MGSTGDRQWQLGSHSSASHRHNLHHDFSAFHVLSHYLDRIVHWVQLKKAWYVKLGEMSEIERCSHLDSKKRNNSFLVNKTKWCFSHLCILFAVLAKSSHFINLYTNPLQNLELWIAKQQKMMSWNFGCSRSFKQLCSKRTFYPEGPFLPFLSRIIVDLITSCSSLPDSSWALEREK